MDLGERKQRVVAAMVDAYILTGEPIGSKTIAERLNSAVSSATIRNDMAELTALGFLEQPHTSAGRLPTAKAFRLYVDHLMSYRPLSNDSRRHIDDMLISVAGDPDRLMERASELLAQATGCAAVAAINDQPQTCIKHVQILPMGTRSAAILLMTDAGGLQSRVCRLDGEADADVLSHITQILDREFAQLPLSEITPARVQRLLLQLLDGHGLMYAPLLTIFTELVQESAKADIRLSGQLNLLQHPDYPAEHVHSLLRFLSSREQLAGMLDAHPGGLCVLIGNESSRPELNGSSIIVTHYSTGKKREGTLGLIGPLRMDYAHTIPRLEYVAQTVGRLLTELFNEK